MSDVFQKIINQLKAGQKLDPPKVPDNTNQKRLKTQNEGLGRKMYKANKNIGIRMYKSFNNDD